MDISILISVVSLVFAVFTYYKTLVHDKKKDTLDAYNCLQEQALDKLYASYKPADCKEIAQHPRLHAEEYREISRYIARIEHFCVGVKQDIYDKEVVYELADGFLNGAIRERIEPIIARKNDRTDNSKDFYENTHFVMTELDKRKSQ